VKLSNLEFIKLLPQFMRNDDAVRGLAAGIDSIIPRLAADVEKMSTWNRIDNLCDAELDDLAWELNIPWYDTNANIEVKRDLVKNSDKVHQHLGTKWAVENVVRSYFGEGRVEEWFEYGGDPGHFRIYTPNPSVANEKFDDFLNMLGKVKRASAKLDSVFITLAAELPVASGVVLHEVSHEQYAIGARP
jgi:phage tail P2-like protein